MAEIAPPPEEVPGPSRRDRARADTLREIKETARRVLVAHGADGLALRAVAREMGMTAPGLYRYFASREDLVAHVVGDLYDELCEQLDAAREAARPSTPAAQLLAVSRSFRHWATVHRREFGLLFGSADTDVVPAGALGLGRGGGPAQRGAARFGTVFSDLVGEVYLQHPFPIRPDTDLTPALREQLLSWSATFEGELPLGVLRIFLSCWIRLYGMVCMEVFGHLRFALEDAEPLFEAELQQLAELLGVPDTYVPAERA